MRIDPASMKVAQTVPHTAGLWCGCLDPEGLMFMAGGTDGRLTAWEYPGFTNPFTFAEAHRSYVHLLAWLSDGYVVSGSYDRRLIWWDAVCGRKVRELQLSARPLGLTQSPDGKLLALVDDERRVRLIEAATGAVALELPDAHPMYTAKMRPSSVYCAAFSPDGRWLATGDRTGLVLVRDTATGRQIKTFSGRRFYSDFNKLPDGTPREAEYELGGVRCLAFSGNGGTLIAGGMDQYNPNSAGIDGPMGLVAFDTPFAALPGAAPVQLPPAAPPGPAIPTHIRWEVTLAQGKGYLQSVLWHPAGWAIAAGGGGTAGNNGLGTLCLVDPTRPAEHVARELQVTVRGLALSADGTQAIVCGMLKTATAGQIEVWDLAAS
jgi:hypothetical protein